MLTSSLLQLYPRAWRDRHADEMRAILEDRPPTLGDRIDLVRGALDARLHPDVRSRLPAVAGITGGAAWTIAGAVTLVEPVPPDWPFYRADLLVLVIAGTICLLAAVVGCWLRLGDARDAADRIAVQLAVAGYVAWLVGLAAVVLGIDYGTTTALASTAAAAGTVAVGLTLLRIGEGTRGALLSAAAVSLLVPATWTFLAFGLAWSAVGLLAIPPRLELLD